MTYIFAIVIRSQVQIREEDQPWLHERFDHLQDIMWNLLLRGAFLDGTFITGNHLLEANETFLFLVFFVFMLLSSQLILNMLVGLLCAVVNAVKDVEKERHIVFYVRYRLMGVLERLDEDGNGTISRDEFDQLLEIPEAVAALKDLGVDVENLVSLSDHLFEVETFDSGAVLDHGVENTGAFSSTDVSSTGFLNSEDVFKRQQTLLEEPEEVALTFADFLEMVFRLRSSEKPSVSNIIELRKLLNKGHKNSGRRMDDIDSQKDQMLSQLQDIQHALTRVSSREKMAALVHWLGEGLREVREAEGVTSLGVASVEPVGGIGGVGLSSALPLRARFSGPAITYSASAAVAAAEAAAAVHSSIPVARADGDTDGDMVDGCDTCDDDDDCDDEIIEHSVYRSM